MNEPQVGIQPRVCINGHYYMLVSEHYAELNSALAAERSIKSAEKLILLDEVGKNKTLVEALTDCATMLAAIHSEHGRNCLGDHCPTLVTARNGFAALASVKEKS